jgi:Ni/Fe-hydrogenase 1 B-type cytochrome subunit
MATVVGPFDPKDLEARPEHYFKRAYIWELPVRITHWVTALCLTGLFITGLYIGSPILTSSGEPANHFLMGRIRQIHFAAGIIFVISFLLRIYWFWAGNNYARSGFPMVWKRTWWQDLFRQAMDYLRLQRGHVHLGHNALGGLAYTFFVIALGWVQIFTGLAMYSETHPGGWLNKLVGWVIPLIGNSYSTHMVHHLTAWAFPIFALLHIYIATYDSTQFGNGLITSIISGYKFYRRGDIRHDEWIS